MDPRRTEADFNFYGEESAQIEWDGESIPALVSDVEAGPGPLETGLEQKVISLRKSDLPVRPEPRDQVALNLFPRIRKRSEYWEIEKVRDLPDEYDITLFRYHR